MRTFLTAAQDNAPAAPAKLCHRENETKKTVKVLVAFGLLVAAQAAIADSLDTWTLRYQVPPPTGPSLLAYGNGTFVALDTAGTGILETSADGVVWVRRRSGPDFHVNAVTSGNGKFVAVGERNLTAASPDGLEWTSVSALRPSAGSDFSGLLKVAYGQGQFVAVGGEHWIITTDERRGTGTRSTILTSTDGIQWIQRQAVMTNILEFITYGNGLFLTGSPLEGIFETSTDGINWTQRVAPFDRILTVAFMNGLFIASAQHGKIATSADGINWNQDPTPDVNYMLYSIAHGNGTFVAAGLGTVFTSTDGTNWVRREPGFEVSGSVTFGAGLFLLAGGGSRFTSLDGVNWTARRLGGPAYLSDVAYGNGKFVAVGDLGWILSSPDGLTWTKERSGVWYPLNSIGFGNGKFVVLVNKPLYVPNRPRGVVTNTVLISTDGLEWQAHEAPVQGNSLDRLGIYGEGHFVALGHYGGIHISPDAVNWASRTTVFSPVALAYGGGRFVGVPWDGAGESLTSSDGITWTFNWSPIENNRDPDHHQWLFLNDITYGANQFVAAGGRQRPSLDPRSPMTGLILTSTDGEKWTDRAAPTTNILGRIAYGGGAFVAFGRSRPVMISSTDGRAWQLRKGPPDVITAVAYGKGRFVALGRDSGTVWESGGISLAILRRTDGAGALLSLEAPVALEYAIETSTDLIAWRTLTNIISHGKATNTILEVPVAGPRRFYRAVSR